MEKQSGFLKKGNSAAAIAAQSEAGIRQALDELMHQEFPSAGVLPLMQRAYLINWMARDPVIQSRMQNYLRRTLR